MKTALIVIDVQESFRHRPYWRTEELPSFIANVQSLIDACRERRIPVLQVLHRELPDHPDNPFAASSGLVRTMPELKLAADAVFYKSVHSAMLGMAPDGGTLEAWLRHHGVEEVLITGIRTEQCCETTARHASDLGFNVRYVTDATLTFPMQARTGRTYSPLELRERTELVLDGRFAQIVSTAQALS
ncbi:MAG TPA: isochorismatase family cysteine hydrolase [Steroidobacteraceae bacterium]|nr:isochorismatase family cysteine hydrolase [Steroidobacteraceae bacterium]